LTAAAGPTGATGTPRHTPAEGYQREREVDDALGPALHVTLDRGDVR
jgi:hypothetical protein